MFNKMMFAFFLTSRFTRSSLPDNYYANNCLLRSGLRAAAKPRPWVWPGLPRLPDSPNISPVFPVHLCRQPGWVTRQPPAGRRVLPARPGRLPLSSGGSPPHHWHAQLFLFRRHHSALANCFPKHSDWKYSGDIRCRSTYMYVNTHVASRLFHLSRRIWHIRVNN